MKPRSSWTDTAPGGAPLSGSVPDLYIHHTGGGVPEGGMNATMGAEAQAIRATRDFHMNHRNMSDIAYSYGFMPSGRSYVLRGHRTGGHTKFQNSISIAFVFFGNSDLVPRAAVDNAIAEMAPERQVRVDRNELTKSHGITGHRDAPGAQTACPGNALNGRLREIMEGDEMTADEKRDLNEALSKARQAFNFAEGVKTNVPSPTFGGAGRWVANVVKDLLRRAHSHEAPTDPGEPTDPADDHVHDSGPTTTGPARPAEEA